MNIIDGLLEKIFLQHAGGPGKFPQTTWAFGAAQVATGGWFKRYRNRKTPLDGFFLEFAELITAIHLRSIHQPADAEFRKKVKAVVEIEIHNVLQKYGYKRVTGEFGKKLEE